MHFTMYAIRSNVKIWDTTTDKYYAIAKMKEKNSQARANSTSVRVYIEKLTRG